jgi:hypothetical protein
MSVRLFVAFLVLSLAGCGYPKVQGVNGGRDDDPTHFSVLYVPLYGGTERDAFQAASARCSPKRATRLYHEYLSFIPSEANRIVYRCD